MLDPVAIIARTCNRGVPELHNTHDFAYMTQRFFDRDCPRPPIRLCPASAHFTIDTDQIAYDAEPVQTMSQLIDAIALGNTRQIQCDGAPFEYPMMCGINIQDIDYRSVGLRL